MVTTNIENQTLPEVAAANECYSVVLRGEVQLLEVKKSSPSEIMLNVSLKMELLNNGSKPVIFLETKPPELRGVALAKSPKDFSASKNLASAYYGESVDTSREWAVLRSELNQSSPPLDKVRVLIPNESWKFDGIVNISLPKNESGKDKFSLSSKKESWETIKQLPAVWLRATVQVWSLNLEPKSSEQTELKFGNELQKRWKDVGLLWLDDIQSEPIALDLKTAVVE
jgi:hypothetical protein